MRQVLSGASAEVGLHRTRAGEAPPPPARLHFPSSGHGAKKPQMRESLWSCSIDIYIYFLSLLISFFPRSASPKMRQMEAKRKLIWRAPLLLCLLHPPVPANVLSSVSSNPVPTQWGIFFFSFPSYSWITIVRIGRGYFTF